MPKSRRPRLSWFRFYADDFLGGTGALTAPECGRYLLLLLHQWGTKDRQIVPSEPERLRVICRGEDPGPLVLSKFTAVDGGLRNERLAEEWDAAAREYNLKAEGGGTKIPSRTPGQIPPRIPHRKGPPTKIQEPNVIPPPPASGSFVPVVSVSASVVTAPASPLAKPVAASKQTWLTPFGDDWREAYGGEPAWGEMAKVLKMPVDALGAKEVRTRWRMYLGRTDGQYASPTRFAQTIGIWTEDAVARMQPRDMRSMTVGDFNAATYERVMKRLQERSHEGQGAIAEGSAQARGLLSD